MTQWTESLEWISLDLAALDGVRFKTDYLVPDTARELEFISLGLFDKAPAAAEAIAIIFSIQGRGFEHVPLELPFPIRGSHLGAIGAGMTTPKQDWYVHLPVNGGEKWDLFYEALDVVASDVFAEVTFGWSNKPLGKPATFSVMDRETAITGVTANNLGNIEITNATKIVEGMGFVVPTGTTTADMPISGLLNVKSAAFEDQKEFSWGVESMQGIDTGTSGHMQAPSIYRARQNIDVSPTTRSPTVKATMQPGQAVTTQLALACWGVRYWK